MTLWTAMRLRMHLWLCRVHICCAAYHGYVAGLEISDEPTALGDPVL